MNTLTVETKDYTITVADLMADPSKWADAPRRVQWDFESMC